MPTGEEFSQKLKQLMFNVIRFVENEKYGIVIALNNVNERLESMLGISPSSIKRLKREMREKEERMMQKKKAMDDAKKNKDDQEVQILRRLRYSRPTSSRTSITTTTTTTAELELPVARSPRKRGHSGRPAIILSEEEQENIR
jgi:hypothetical protein